MNINDTDLKIFINRKSLFYDAYDQIMNKSPHDLKNRLRIIYKEEKGMDAGGLLR